MNNYTTQYQWAEDRLVNKGQVSRNDALKNYISRLGAIIYTMRQEGWDIHTTYVPTVKPNGAKGKDCVYVCVALPKSYKRA